MMEVTDRSASSAHAHPDRTSTKKKEPWCVTEEVRPERLGWLGRRGMVEILLLRIVEEEAAVARLTTCLGLEPPSPGKGPSAQRDNVLEGCDGQNEGKTPSEPDCVGSHTLAFVFPTP